VAASGVGVGGVEWWEGRANWPRPQAVGRSARFADVRSAMAPLPTISFVNRVVLKWQHTNGQRAVSVMNVLAPTGSTTDIWAAFDAHWTLHMLVCQASGLNCSGVDITPLDGSSATDSFGAPTLASGSGGADFISQGATIVAIKSAERGPAARGRLFLPFVAEATQNAGFLTTVEHDQAQSAWSQFQTDMATDGIGLGVASYKHSEWHDATHLVVRPVLGTQKRRIDRVRG